MTAREFVLRVFPTACVYDDGESCFFIFLEEKMVAKCPYCERPIELAKPFFLPTKCLGSGKDESAAWKDAATKLGWNILDTAPTH